MWRIGDIVPLTPNLGTRWRWVVSIMPQMLYSQGKCLHYPLYRRMGGPKNWSRHIGEDENYFSLSEIKAQFHSWVRDFNMTKQQTSGRFVEMVSEYTYMLCKNQKYWSQTQDRWKMSVMFLIMHLVWMANSFRQIKFFVIDESWDERWVQFIWCVTKTWVLKL